MMGPDVTAALAHDHARLLRGAADRHRLVHAIRAQRAATAQPAKPGGSRVSGHLRRFTWRPLFAAAWGGAPRPAQGQEASAASRPRRSAAFRTPKS